MIDTNVMLVGGAILVILLIVFLMPWGGKCNCSEGYKGNKSAEFTVKRPKYQVPPNHPQKSPGQKENWIIPMPSKAQTLKSDNLRGGTIGPTSNPFMGAIYKEAEIGPSTPPRNTAALVSGNGQGDPGSMNVWATVI